MNASTLIVARSAKMPQSCMGRYARLGVVQTTDGREPSMLSARARTVTGVLETCERLHVGTSPRCQYQRTLADLQARYPDAKLGASVARFL